MPDALLSDETAVVSRSPLPVVLHSSGEMDQPTSKYTVFSCSECWEKIKRGRGVGTRLGVALWYLLVRISL